MKEWDRPDYDSGLSFTDMLFNYLLAFGFLLAIALMLIRPPTEPAKSVSLRAEFVLTMTWPDGSFDDVDLWLMLPDGKKVFFRQQDVEYVTLDRDDLGAMRDFYTDGNGQRQLATGNREMMTIRAIVPGRYVVAAHVYAANATATDYDQPGKEWRATVPLPYAASLEVTKLNPRVTEVLKATVQLAERGQEAVFAAFEVDADGKVTGVELNPSQYKIVDLVPTWAGEEGTR